MTIHTQIDMPRIRQLGTSVVTKIAAGEVIERPASVVKELLENSVDAGAERVDIEIEQGGAERIRIVDDGCGIEPEDLPLAFSSHATSKLADADDLFRIGTLGFRGEALASIGGVGRVTLQSRPAGRICGAEISCEGGKLSQVRDWNGAPGTRIEVRHLFFNTPVRRKFLRTATTEMGHISEIFTRVALAHPGLHLTLRHNGKDVYEVPAAAGLRERIGLFFGQQISDNLYPVEEELGPARLFGFITDPSCERGNAKMQYLFLNGRWIRDRSLGHALQEAYRGLLMTGRYAVAFLFLELPPDQVDVNVHPTKVEVRFRDGQAMYSFMRRTVRERLSAENLTARLHVTSTLNAPTTVQNPPAGFMQPQPFDTPKSLFDRPSPSPSAPTPSAETEPLQSQSPEQKPEPPPPAQAAVESQQSAAWTDAPPVKAIQLYNAYIVQETPEGMLVVDQHALHERILFEQLKRRVRSGQIESQSLLIPETLEIPAEQAAKTLEHKSELEQLGFGVDDFGGGTLLLTRYPAIIGNRPPIELLKGLIDFLVSKDRVPTREQLLSDLLSLMACHSAVRVGDPLTPDEISSLLAQRELADDTHHCPHGRPTALLFSRQDLDRQFRRV